MNVVTPSVPPDWRLRLRRAAVASLRIPDWAAQRVVRPSPRLVCYASEPDYADNAAAMFRHLLRTRAAIDHLWLVRDSSVEAEIRAEFDAAAADGHSLRVAPLRLRSYPRFLRAQVAFHTHGLYSFSPPSRGRTSVSLWHGMPVKAIRRLHDGNRILFEVRGTHHVASSHFFKYVIAAAFGVSPTDVLVSGLPRTDVLKGFAPAHRTRRAIGEALGVDPARPWLLWLPTHRSEPDFRGTKPPASFLDALGRSEVDRVLERCAQAGVEVIVKLHPLDLLNQTAQSDPTLLRERARLVSSPEWQRLQIPLYDLVAQSAGLLTDVSSICIDYLHTGRPVGILGFDPDSYTRETLFDPSQLFLCHSVQAIDSESDLTEFVGAVNAGTRPGLSPDDPARIFVEDADFSSAEHILRTVGL